MDFKTYIEVFENAISDSAIISTAYGAIEYFKFIAGCLRSQLLPQIATGDIIIL